MTVLQKMDDDHTSHIASFLKYPSLYRMYLTSLWLNEIVNVDERGQFSAVKLPHPPMRGCKANLRATHDVS